GAGERFDISYCIERGSFAEGERKTAAEKVDEILRALRTAAARWEAVADVRFRHAAAEDDSCGPANGDVDFNVREVAANDKYSASAFFPGDPREESELKVARDAFDLQGSVVDDVMTHELGHVLGFRHEHVRREAPHQGGAGCYDESIEGLIALTPHDRLSVMTYPECLGDPQTQYLISPADEDGALALYGSPGRLQPGGAVPVAWRRFVEGVGASPEPVGRALRARRGTTFVAVLRGQPIVDLPNLFVNVGAPAAAGASTCQPALENDTPEVCRVAIAADRDEDVYIAVSSGDAARSATFGLYVAYVPASGG
ncbi:MAG TPA: M57 family metalloprotease, partial [Polyangiaceae bacterium]|nr:M57 family metalloprotease [Polyangiaceae bacterium]